MLMPFPTSSLPMGPGLYKTSTVGTEKLIDPPTEGEGRNVQGRSKPAGIRREGGSGYSLQRQAADQAVNTMTLGGQQASPGASTHGRNQQEGDTSQAMATTRIRNEPVEWLDQPR